LLNKSALIERPFSVSLERFEDDPAHGRSNKSVKFFEVNYQRSISAKSISLSMEMN